MLYQVERPGAVHGVQGRDLDHAGGVLLRWAGDLLPWETRGPVEQHRGPLERPRSSSSGVVRFPSTGDPSSLPARPSGAVDPLRHVGEDDLAVVADGPPLAAASALPVMGSVPAHRAGSEAGRDGAGNAAGRPRGQVATWHRVTPGSLDQGPDPGTSGTASVPSARRLDFSGQCLRAPGLGGVDGHRTRAR